MSVRGSNYIQEEEKSSTPLGDSGVLRVQGLKYHFIHLLPSYFLAADGKEKIIFVGFLGSKRCSAAKSFPEAYLF